MKRKTMRKAIRSPLLALALVLVFAGTVLATARSGFNSTIVSRGTLSESVHYNTGAVKFQTKGSVAFVTATVTIDPLGYSGWHSHPGVVLVTVASGSLVVYDEHCVGTTHTANTPSSAFTESGDEPGFVRNESATTPEVSNVVYIVPAGVQNMGLRIDRNAPACTLP
jgi:quercetin dioxygenase-like cupin family protein